MVVKAETWMIQNCYLNCFEPLSIHHIANWAIVLKNHEHHDDLFAIHLLHQKFINIWACARTTHGSIRSSSRESLSFKEICLADFQTCTLLVQNSLLASWLYLLMPSFVIMWRLWARFRSITRSCKIHKTGLLADGKFNAAIRLVRFLQKGDRKQ